MTAPRRAARAVAALGLVALAVAKGIALSLFVPPFHGPDEPYHFDYVQALAENGALPRPQARCAGPMLSPEVGAAVGQVVNGVAFHPARPVPSPAALRLPSGAGSRATSGCGPASIYPPVWYASAAIAYRGADGRPLLGRLLAVRWTSVAWSAAGALAAFALGLLAFATFSDALVYGLVVVLQPMTGALGAVANSEAAALACATAVFAAIACVWRGVAPLRATVAAAVLLTLGVLTKPGFLLALPTFAGLLLCAPPRGSARQRLGRVLAVLAPAAVAALAFGLSGGERSGLYDEIAPTGTVGQQLARHLLGGRRLFDVWVEQYWGKLGWMDAQPGRGWYVALTLATVAAVLALIAERRHRARERAILALVTAGSLLFAAALYAVAWRRGDLLWVQGRHILVLFPAHAYLLVRGLTALRRRLPRALDPRVAFVLLLLGVNGALIAAAERRFYGRSSGRILAEWQAAWGVPWMVPGAVAAVAIALALVAWAGWARPVRWRPDRPTSPRPD